jgi:hypothetical protein
MSTRFGALAAAPGGEKILPSAAEPVVVNAPAPGGVGSEPPASVVLAEEDKA